MPAISKRSPQSAGRGRNESPAAVARSRRSNGNYSPAIWRWKGCAWRCRIGRQSFASWRERLSEMQQRLYRRLRQLEAECARLRVVQDSKAGGACLAEARRKIELFLQMRGVEQSPRESLMDAWARALGISNRELRAQLMEGISPIRKWCTDHGIYEEIERRKAAGMWPAAQGMESQDVRL